jgi:hypothetical protein
MSYPHSLCTEMAYKEVSVSIAEEAVTIVTAGVAPW